MGQEVNTAISLSDLLQVTISGLASGSIYVLVLIGILLIYQVSGAVNFAHGAIGMFAAFGSYFLYATVGLPVALSVLVGLASATGLAIVIDRVILAHVPPDRPGYDLVVTLGVLLFLTAMAQVWFGNNTYSYLTLLTRSSVTLGGVYISLSDVSVILLAAATVVGGAVVLRRTSIGLSIRATAADPSVAQSVGLNVGSIRASVWGAAGLLAGVSGVLVASRLSVNAFYMTPILIKAFIAGIIGGLDRFAAPLLAAIGLGVYEAWVVFLLGARFRSPAVFILIIVLLAVAPRSLLEERNEARA